MVDRIEATKLLDALGYDLGGLEADVSEGALEDESEQSIVETITYQSDDGELRTAYFHEFNVLLVKKPGEGMVDVYGGSGARRMYHGLLDTLTGDVQEQLHDTIDDTLKSFMREDRTVGNRFLRASQMDKSYDTQERICNYRT